MASHLAMIIDSCVRTGYPEWRVSTGGPAVTSGPDPGPWRMPMPGVSAANWTPSAPDSPTTHDGRAAGCVAAHRTVRLRLLDGHDGAGRFGTGPLGRVPPGSEPAHRDDHRDRLGAGGAGGAAGLDPAAQPARHRHRRQR